MHNLRTDIQALRGWAVLLVLFFHAQIGPLKAGYLGVDIFFVISGFLITSLIAKGIDQGNFSFKEFYFRRARRLLPAAYTVLFFTAIAAVFFLTPNEYGNFKNQLIGSVTFTANIALFDQSDYFSGDAKLKPLLHMWSLAIEEQYYLLLPLCMFFLPRRFWAKGAALLFGSSLALCLYLVSRSPDFTFYMLPTRLWELAIGSVGALYLVKKDFGRYYKWLFWPALAALILVPVYPYSKTHPGVDALIVCVATLIIILAQGKVLNNNFVAKALAKVGDYSYPLYLVHWPLFAFASNAYLGMGLPLEVRASLLGVSFVLAFLLHHLVEQPIRYAPFKQSHKAVAGFVAASVLLLMMPLLNAETDQTKYYKDLRRANYGLDEKCAYNDKFTDDPACRTGDKPEILFWGDSFAMHLIPGLSKTLDKSMVQITRSACAPFLGISQVTPPRYSVEWAKGCIAFNDDVIKYVREHKSLKTVVISSPFASQLGPKVRRLSLLENGEYEEGFMGDEFAMASMSRTVKTLKDMGKTVVLISPPPRGGYNTGLCLERNGLGKVTFGDYKTCYLSREMAEKRQIKAYTFLDEVEQKLDVTVLNLIDYMCDDKVCHTRLNDKLMYADAGHLSYEGSDALAKYTDFAKDINRLTK